jgi:hypothetical protein
MMKRRGAIRALLTCCVALYAFVPIAIAQGPIRVESNQVLVPTVVFDKKLYALTDKKHHKQSLSYLITQDPHFWDTIAVRGLAAKDFHIFEDGKEQGILNVTFEAPTFSIVADNFGRHSQTIGSGGGRWIYPDLIGPDLGIWLPWPQYVVAFVPAASPAGSCHQIQVKVGHSNLEVWARSEYCNTPHPSSDSLNGTEFGKQMEGDLASAEAGKIDLKLQAVALYGDSGTARVNIQLQFPWKSLQHEFKDGVLNANIGAVGVIYDKDGGVAARFSDFACCDYGKIGKPPSSQQASENLTDRTASMIPNGYETQIDLPPGEYEVRVVVSDGEKFGRQQVPLSVRPRGGNELTVSDIALCRRIQRVTADSAELPAKLPGNYIPLVTRGVEYTPSADARFMLHKTLYAYFDVYDPKSGGLPAPKLSLHLIVRDGKTGDIAIDFAPVDATPYMQANTPLFRIGRGIDLGELPEGSYQLEIQATDSTGSSTEWRKAAFVIDNGGLTPFDIKN